jgi:tRNA 2-thiouridine synthesizing protein E
MSVQTIAGKPVDFDEEGFMTDPTQWDEDIAAALAEHIGINALTQDHWTVIKFAREDYDSNGETPTLRRITSVAGIPTKQLYQLFPKKPAKKLAFISGLQKPSGCI